MNYQESQNLFVRKMEKSRIVGIDVIKGITIFMMIIVHSITQVIADYDGSVFLTLLPKIPKIVLYCVVAPLVIMGLWGTIFTFVTGITTAISTIRILNTNKRAFPSYLLQRLLFLALLRFAESVCDAFFDSRYDIFNNGKIVIPPIKIGGNATTLDSIGWAGIISPLVIYVFYPLIKREKKWLTVVILSLITYGSLLVSPYIVDIFDYLSKSGYYHDMGLFGDIFGKVAYGRFKIAQTGAFAVVGAIYGILIQSNVSIFSMIVLGLVYFVIGIIYLVVCFMIDPDCLIHFVDDDVPLCAQVFSLGGIAFLAFIHCYFVDGNRPLHKKLKSRKHCVFVLRLSMLTLTIFCTGSWVGRQLALPFIMLFGPPCIHGTVSKIIWDYWVCILFIIAHVLLWWGIALLWEKNDFKYSLEYILGSMLAKFVGKEYHPNSRQFVYGPTEEIKQLMQQSTETEVIVEENKQQLI